MAVRGVGVEMKTQVTWIDWMYSFASWLNRILERGYDPADIETGC